MGGQKVEIGQGLNSRLTLGGISHHMVEHTAIMVHPRLIALPVHLGLRQHGSIRGHDLSPHNPVGKAVQTRIV